jgi:hypothetical protein
MMISRANKRIAKNKGAYVTIYRGVLVIKVGGADWGFKNNLSMGQ